MVDTKAAPRLLITTAAVGSGHVSAANAVAQAAAAELVDDLVATVWQPRPPAAPVAA